MAEIHSERTTRRTPPIMHVQLLKASHSFPPALFLLGCCSCITPPLTCLPRTMRVGREKAPITRTSRPPAPASHSDFSASAVDAARAGSSPRSLTTARTVGADAQNTQIQVFSSSPVKFLLTHLGAHCWGARSFGAESKIQLKPQAYDEKHAHTPRSVLLQHAHTHKISQSAVIKRGQYSTVTLPYMS